MRFYDPWCCTLCALSSTRHAIHSHLHAWVIPPAKKSVLRILPATTAASYLLGQPVSAVDASQTHTDTQTSLSPFSFGKNRRLPIPRLHACASRSSWQHPRKAPRRSAPSGRKGMLHCYPLERNPARWRRWKRDLWRESAASLGSALERKRSVGAEPYRREGCGRGGEGERGYRLTSGMASVQIRFWYSSLVLVLLHRQRRTT